MTEQEWLNTFGDNLKSFLEEENMTQLELSRISGINISSINKYIHKCSIPTVKNIIKLAYALDCSTDDLIDFGGSIK